MKYVTGFVVVLAALVTLICCSMDEQGQSVSGVQPTPAVVENISAQEIADRVERAYRECVCLCVHAEIRQEPIDGDYTRRISGGTDLITVDSVMIKDSFQTRVFNALGEPIREFSLKNGMLRECNFRLDPETGENLSKGVEYVPLYSHGIDNPKLKTEIDCLIGAHTFSWAGVPADNDLPVVTDRARSMRTKILNGVREADAVVRNMDCYVFRQKIPVGNDVIEHVVFIDKESYDVRRWDTIQSGVHRKREYGVIRYDTIPVTIPFLREGGDPSAEGRV